MCILKKTKKKQTFFTPHNPSFPFPPPPLLLLPPNKPFWRVLKVAHEQASMVASKAVSNIRVLKMKYVQKCGTDSMILTRSWVVNWGDRRWVSFVTSLIMIS